MKIGDKVEGHALKADGDVYRSWYATVEAIEPNLIVTVAPAGSLALMKDGLHSIAHHLRSYYWLDKFYNLLEVFEPDGTLIQLYLNIASPPEITEDAISFKDHELDVLKVLPHEARIIDEDEFAEAIHKYNYSEEFQRKMYAAAHEALVIADNWVPKPAPVFEEDR
jgi:protein associated with RNAse G/E